MNNKNDKSKTLNQEAKKDRKEAEKRRKKAKMMGIPELISGLYHDNIKYYPSWINHSREYVPTIVERAHKQEDGYNKEKVEIVLNNKICLFKYQKPLITDYGQLKLYIDGKKVFAVSEEEYHDEYYDNYHPILVDAFVEGEWINDFQQLDKQIKILEEKRAKEGFENSAEISKLKKDFGLK
ncbi:MAG: hypothetical protein SCARUB_00370 [Candidatus Scalindua rubra]|uniref:Uncharacterized protein n=1 Tax=Candidatus Scalindua rubra TaxID=1872076 RepID=A0A1E3XHV4_9BACT|nr:MAG: hypothetical protein SCARUB_00370 [Candidatus Scalindua rubra]